MKEYLIQWCDDSGVYWCPITNSKSYFVGDCLEEIAVDAGKEHTIWGLQSESQLLHCLKEQGLVIKLIDIATQRELDWEI